MISSVFPKPVSLVNSSSNETVLMWADPKQMDWMFTHLSVRLAPCGLIDIQKTVRHPGEQCKPFKCSMFRDLLQRFELPRQYQPF